MLRSRPTGRATVSGTPGMLTPPTAERTPGFSWTTRIRATSVVLVEGAIALADVDGLELAAVLEAAGDRLDAVGGERLSDGDAGEVGDLLVRQEGVAVNADFADDLAAWGSPGLTPV